MARAAWITQCASRFPRCASHGISQLSNVSQAIAVTAKCRRRDQCRSRIASRQHGEHKRRRPRSTTTAESARTRSSHIEYPGTQDASQGARREHHQRPADGLKVNRRFVRGAHRCRSRDSVTSKRATTLPAQTFQIPKRRIA